MTSVLWIRRQEKGVGTKILGCILEFFLGGLIDTYYVRAFADPPYSSDSNRKPVALISNITLIPPSTRSKNDAITSIYTSTFSQKYTITLIDTSMQF